MSHNFFLKPKEIWSNVKEAVEYPTAVVAGGLYRASQAFHGSNRPSQSTLQRQTGSDLTWREDAHLAKGAYTSSPVEGYTIDPELTYGNITTYKNNKTGKATVSFAGTKGVKDIKSDLAILAGVEQNDPQFQQALEMSKKAVKKYGQENVHVTGHSLGGTKATYVSSKLGIKATTFNQGWFGGSLTHATSIGDKWNTSKVKDYVTPGDLISATTYVTPGRNVTSIPQEEKLKKLKNMFKVKGYEAAARTSIPEQLGAIPEIGPVIAGAYAIGGAYKLGKVQYDLHKMDNFIQPSRPQSARTQQDRVNAVKDRVKTEKIVTPTIEKKTTVEHKPVPILPSLPPQPVTYDEQSRVHTPYDSNPGMPQFRNQVLNYGFSHVVKTKRPKRKTKGSKRRPRHVL